MPWSIVLVKSAQKQLHTFPQKSAEFIFRALEAMETNPWSGDVVKLAGEDAMWRRRVGSYRIVFAIDLINKTVYIYAILRRTSSTY